MRFGLMTWFTLDLVESRTPESYVTYSAQILPGAPELKIRHSWFYTISLPSRLAWIPNQVYHNGGRSARQISVENVYHRIQICPKHLGFLGAFYGKTQQNTVRRDPLLEWAQSRTSTASAVLRPFTPSMPSLSSSPQGISFYG